MRAPLACWLSLCACTGLVGGVPPPKLAQPPDASTPVPPVVDSGVADSGGLDASVADAGVSMLLTVSGSSFQLDGGPVEVRGAISCCGGGYGWPLFDDGWLGYTRLYGVNFLHARLGPFLTQSPNGETDWAAVGGGYLETNGKADLSQFNPAFWERLRQLLQSARAAGQWVELDVADGWAVKHCVAGDLPGYSAWDPAFNLQGEDACTPAGTAAIVPGSTQDRWVRQVVAVSGEFDNVLYQDGNEVGLIPGYSSAWTQSLVATLRDEESRHGYPKHPVATNSGDAAAIALPGIDYVELHQPAAASLAQCASKPCLVNEYNPSPALTPQQFQQQACAARAAGTWFWYWRHGQTDQQMAQSLTLQAQACPMNDCRFPQGVPEADFTGHSDVDPQLGDTVNAVMEQLSGCNRGSDCYIGDRWPDAQSWFAAVNGQLRARGYCAGQHEEGATDEIAVSETGCTGLWYGYHVYYYGGQKVVWSPGAQRGSWSILPSDCP